MTDIIIETERLYIRQITREDLPDIQKIKEENWGELQKWMSWASNDQKPFSALLKNFEDQVVPDFEKGALRLVAQHKKTDDRVMFSGLDITDQTDVYSTGYWGNLAYLGKGYATEVTKAVLKYAFNVRNAKKITIDYYEGNIASKRVIEKCDFVFVETKPKAHQSFATGEYMDVHCYSIDNANHLHDFNVKWGDKN
ncbi:MAG: hypothetical protein COB76_04790 [Alphaproteobacteria bacterium]|nr:MAG: hypothetical protein COB76_04790 [Alphaproteobacteria bacterium]